MSGAPDQVSPVVVARRGTVLEVTLNRPERRNAIDLATAVMVGQAMDLLDADPGLSVAIIAGAGGTFSAGMDLKAFAAGERPVVPGKGFAGLIEAPPRKPLIAAVEGYALAGGMEVALAADLIVAASDAVFGIPEVKRGLVAAGGALLKLGERLPFHVAMDLALTGRRLDATEAMEWGLVARLAEPGEALACARELAATIADNGPLALRVSKQVLYAARDWPRDEMFARQRELTNPVFASADAAEGALAFTQKRPPVWTLT